MGVLKVRVVFTLFTLNYSTVFCPKGFQKSLLFIKKKKRDFSKVEEGSGFCSGTHNNHAMYSTAHCPQDLRHLFFFCTKKEKIFLEQRLCCFVSNI